MIPTSPALLRRALASLLLAAACVGLLATSASAQDAPAADGRVVDILPIEGFIDPPVADAIVELIEDANARGSELVVLQLSSPGVVSADVARLTGAIARSDVPVVTFVGPRGASAEARGGAGLVALSGHVVAMAEDATLGPVVPVDLADEDADVLLDELGELAGPLASLELVPGELADLGVEVLDATGLEPLLVELDGREVVTGGGPVTVRIRSEEIVPRLHSLGLLARMLHAAATPAFVYLLFVVGLAMLLFEVFQPGFGVAGIAGLVMAAIGVFGITVLPVTWWAVALVVLGLVLFSVDVAVAGFGALTLLSTAAFGVGSWAFYDSPQLTLPTWLVAATTLAALLFFVLVMTVVLRAQAGPDTEAVDTLVGRVGMVRSVLNPEGHVYIDGALWRARWTGEGRRAKVGTPVRVHGIEGPLVLVERFDPAETRDQPTDAHA